MERSTSSAFRFFLPIEGFMTKKTVTAKSKKHLKALIREAIKKDGYKCDLNFIDVSKITDMSGLFDFNSDNELGKFNGDISKWNVSNVTDMSRMFSGSEFNGDISKWDVSNVTDMRAMFECSKFDGDISNWNVSNVTNMNYMFSKGCFKGDISKWDISKLKNRKLLFCYSKIPFFPAKPAKIKPETKVVAKSKKHLIKLIEKVIDEKGWKADLNFIDVSQITDMSELFRCYPNNDIAGFYGNISQWDVSNVKNMKGLFGETIFKSDISEWDVSNVTDMSEMFMSSEFNGDISKWDVSSVTNMKFMFYQSCFNGDIEFGDF